MSRKVDEDTYGRVIMEEDEGGNDDEAEVEVEVKVDEVWWVWNRNYIKQNAIRDRTETDTDNCPPFYFLAIPGQSFLVPVEIGQSIKQMAEVIFARKCDSAASAKCVEFSDRYQCKHATRRREEQDKNKSQ